MVFIEKTQVSLLMVSHIRDTELPGKVLKDGIFFLVGKIIK